MKQKPPQIVFGENKHDAFDGDLLDRKQEIFVRTTIIEHVATPVVMALDAPWGAGKTTFVKMWRRHLKNGKIPALYFNAWATDYAADPLVPFVEALSQELPKKTSRMLITRAKALAPAFAGILARNVAGDEAAKIAENFVEDWLGHQSKIDTFQRALENYAKAQKEERVVVFVDELDRCRPDYAVKVLERIKHLFEVPGLIFVLAINREQLCHSVRTLYGADIDADTYLRRFIDFDLTIGQPDIGRFILSRLTHLEVDKFLDSRKLSFQDDSHHLCQAIELFAKMYNYSLRDAEQLLGRIVLALYALEDSGKNKFPFHPPLLAFLAMARLQMPEHYRKYTLPVGNGEEMIVHWQKELKASGIYRRDSKYALRDYDIADNITAHIIMAKYSDMQHKPQSPGVSDFIRFCGQQEEELPSGAKQHLVTLYHQYPDRINLQRIVKKVEMLEPLRYQLSHSKNNDG